MFNNRDYVRRDRQGDHELWGGNNEEGAARGSRGLKHYPLIYLQTRWKITKRLARIASNRAEI